MKWYESTESERKRDEHSQDSKLNSSIFASSVSVYVCISIDGIKFNDGRRIEMNATNYTIVGSSSINLSLFSVWSALQKSTITSCSREHILCFFVVVVGAFAIILQPCRDFWRTKFFFRFHPLLHSLYLCPYSFFLYTFVCRRQNTECSMC